MRTVHAGPRPQHPLAGCQRLNSPGRGAKAHRSTGARTYGEGRMSRIKTVLGLAVAAAMLLANAAQAQSNYPNRPIRVIVPYPAGGIVDIVARAVTEQVGRYWKQTVVIEARPGGNSNIGTASVAGSEPDGYTWLVTGPAALVNPTLYKDAGWEGLKDLRCVGLAVWNQSVALVHPSMTASTIKEFVDIT